MAILLACGAARVLLANQLETIVFVQQEGIVHVALKFHAITEKVIKAELKAPAIENKIFWSQSGKQPVNRR